ncbi:hypothetical protein M0805_005079 [Coniferiporia weirii]|nr:hypothetical protein M0805_005079 [Coniferiporia weirii]
MPLSQSDSVDSFLTWLAAPPAAGGQLPLNGVPDPAKLRELRKNPLEDMARPLLLASTNASTSSPGGRPAHASAAGKTSL